MIRHTILLLFLYGIGSSTGRPQNEVAEAREEIQRERIKESEVGANGSGGEILHNFRNPVLEYLKLGRGETRRNGVIREIRHGQTLLVPGGIIPSVTPGGEETRPVNEEVKIPEKSVTSPVLQLNKTEGVWTKTETFPAAAVVVSTYNRDGSLKSSVTHFRPLGVPAIFGSSMHRPQMTNSGPTHPPPQRINWPFANYFPIVINDPFLAAYNGITSSMYNTFSTMIEYGPEADICRKKENRKEGEEYDEVTLAAEVKLLKPSTEKSKESRKRRDTTGIEVSFKNGDRVDLRVEEPKFRSGVVLPAEAEERTRAHTVMLVNPPPITSLLKPTGTGLNMKKKGTKPQKFEKEGNEGGSEEVGEETEDATQSGANDGVAVSPPPDGASVAEAKPVGLAIAGPGGLAAAKPQGTAVAGPGGLAIARPIGTAIAGVDVEGAIPIGGQQKNKNKNKKPKQDPEKMDDDAESELHYVGGLTGPIGNPQPNTKDFGKESPAKSRSQENLLFQGKFNSNMYQLKLGEQDGKYGFVPFMSSPLRSPERIQKRMDNPTFFHGLIGNRNFQGHLQQGQIYPDFYY